MRGARRSLVGLAIVGVLVVSAACESDPAPTATDAGAGSGEPTTSTAAPDLTGRDGADPSAPGPGDSGDDTDGSNGSATTDPTDPADVVTGGTAVSLPGRSAGYGSIRTVDFADLTYPTSACFDVIDDPPARGFPLVDGQVRATEDEEAGPYTVTLRPERSFGDVDGDGDEDAALILECSRGGQAVPMGWIYTVGVAGPQPLAGVVLDPDSLPITGVLDTSLTTLRIAGPTVTTGWDIYLDGDALCCPSKRASVTWSWTEGGLTPGPPTIARSDAG